jgi:hypothetical protein
VPDDTNTSPQPQTDALTVMTIARDTLQAQLDACIKAKTDAEAAALQASNMHAQVAADLGTANGKVSTLESQLSSANSTIANLQNQLAAAKTGSSSGLTSDEAYALSTLGLVQAKAIAKLEWLCRQYGADSGNVNAGMREALEFVRLQPDPDFSATLKVKDAREVFLQSIEQANNAEQVLSAALAYAKVLLL